MLLAWAIIVLLILFTGLYVAAEFAAVSARRGRLRGLAQDGNTLAARLLPVLENPRELDRYIAASQVGITLSSLILGAYGQAALAPHIAPLFERMGSLQPATANSTAAAVVLVCLTMLAVVLGELVPKSLALQHPTRTALFTVLPMQWSMRAFAWSIWFLNGSGVLLLRLLRVPSSGHRHVHSPDEIALLIAESRDGGLLEPEEQVRLHRALRLSLRTARQLMVPRARLAAIEASLPFHDVLRVVASSPYSRLPVYRGSLDTVVGILHIKDVVMRFVTSGRLSVASLLRPIARVPDSMPADRLLAFLRERRSHQALVVDSSDTVVGLITLEDVVGELLGGVADEFKGAQLRPIRLSDGRLRLPGLMRLEQAAPLIGQPWSGAAETVGGLIVERLGRVPAPGEETVIDGVPVEIEAVEGGGVASVIVGARPVVRDGDDAR
ncbi:MAG: magnesium and cobalt exporter, family [Acidobacteriota bacterium]|jgi:CBS domain containing-hemolysin-like protein